MRLEGIVEEDGGFDSPSDRRVVDVDRGGRCRFSNDGGVSHGRLGMAAKAARCVAWTHRISESRRCMCMMCMARKNMRMLAGRVQANCMHACVRMLGISARIGTCGVRPEYVFYMNDICFFLGSVKRKGRKRKLYAEKTQDCKHGNVRMGKGNEKSLDNPLNYLGWATSPSNYKIRFSTP